MTKTMLCRPGTTFTPSGALDEDAFRKHLQRFVDAKVGVYLGSAGSGEGHALTGDELTRVYEIGVEVCKGKVAVYANPPESHTARGTIEQTLRAVDAGVEVVNLYGPAGWHGFKPTDAELMAFFDTVLSAVNHPIAIAPNPVMGYTPKVELMVEICHKYPQITHLNLSGQGEGYFIDLLDQLKRPVQMYVLFTGSLNALNLGAAGILSPEANIIPKTFRRYLDLYNAKDYEGATKVYVELKRFIQYVSKWNPSNPRWIKMAMKVLKLPGGEGSVREPYRLPAEEEIERFKVGLLKLGIPEIDEMAKAAGIA